MRMKLLVTIACIALVASSVSAQAETAAIGVAWDPAGTICERSQAVGVDGTLYILAYTRDRFAGGTTGAEFRLDGFPPDWIVLSLTRNPQSNVVIGSPLTGGCDIGFPACQFGESGVVLLFTLHFLATSPVTQSVLSIHAHSNPSDPSMPCPLLFECDDPCLCSGCVSGGTAAINYPGYCVVAAQAKSWSGVRSLYR